MWFRNKNKPFSQLSNFVNITFVKRLEETLAGSCWELPFVQVKKMQASELQHWQIMLNKVK